MEAQTIRLTKEARQMLWPCGAVTMAGLLSFVPAAPGRGEWGPTLLFHWMLPLGMFVGIPLLASLALGYEFQYRTLPLLVAQPAERRQIWRDKFVVTWAMVITPAAIFLASARTSNVFDKNEFMFAVFWIVAATAAGTFWTLLARSTVGGLVLNSAVQATILLGWSHLVGKLREQGHFSSMISGAGATALLGYTGMMIWLGRRAFLRYQAIDGAASDDVLPAFGARLVPDVIAERFRCRPTGAVLNLIRRDVNLLRPVWLLVAVSLLAWTSLVAFGVLPERAYGGPPPSVTFVSIAISILLSLTIAVLAGALALGEEKTMGTHDWHITVPVSIGMQWVVRLIVALFAGVLCGGLLPASLLIALGAMSGLPFRFIQPNMLWLWPTALAVITLLAFWCATVVKGTVKAALCVFPVLFSFLLVAESGSWMAFKAGDAAAGPIGVLVMKLDPFRVAGVYWSTLHAILPETLLPKVRAEVMTELWLIPTLAFAIWSSYRLFRGQAEDANRHLVRCWVPLVAVAFLCSLAFWGTYAVVQRAQSTKAMVLRETHQAIQELQHAANTDAARPLRLSVDDLAKASPLSEVTRHWLRDSSITVTAATLAEARAFAGRCGTYSSCFPLFSPAERVSSYTATITRADGSGCKLAFQSTSFERSRGPAGVLAGTCER